VQVEFRADLTALGSVRRGTKKKAAEPPLKLLISKVARFAGVVAAKSNSVCPLDTGSTPGDARLAIAIESNIAVPIPYIAVAGIKRAARSSDRRPRHATDNSTYGAPDCGTCNDARSRTGRLLRGLTGSHGQAD